MGYRLEVIGNFHHKNLREFISQYPEEARIKPSGSAHLMHLEHQHGVSVNRAMIHKLAQKNDLDILISDQMPLKCKLLVADMEATIIQDEMLDILAAKRGIGEQVSNITERAMMGEIDFSQSLIERTRLLKGTPLNQLVEIAQEMNYTPGAKILVQTMKSWGAKTILVTGGFDIFANIVADECGFDTVVANQPVSKNGVLTGELRQPICSAKTKREVLMQNCGQFAIAPEEACCIGDGANDILMLQTCGLAVSYRGKPIVQHHVNQNITQGDLCAALLAQGVLPNEFVIK